jgi:diamine N-acetyltransferase
MASSLAPQIRPGSPAAATALAAIGATTFRATYASDVPTEALESFVAGLFGVEAQAAELADPRCSFLLAALDDDLVGYSLVRDAPAPACVPGDSPLLLDRLYVEASAQGLGIGTALLTAVVETARSSGHDVVWLSVWEHNLRAIAIYARWGFVDVGEVAFDLAGEPQLDRVLALDLRRSL